MVAPTFVNTTGGEMPIDSLAIIGATEDNQAEIQVMDGDGRWIGHYYWNVEYTDPDTGDVYDAGWFNSNWEPAGITLKPGEGVYLYTSLKTLSIQSSGQVGGVERNLAVGYTMIGNGTPIDLPIDNMAILGATEDNQAEIQIMDEDGKWIGHYYWNVEYTDPDTGDVYDAGWFNSNWESAGITLKPGESVYTYVSASGLSVKINSPIK